MIYAMSDIHGCYDKYKAMLEKIRFSEEDTLYVLGDVVDRGPAGLKTLLDMGKRKNVILLKGNHDQQTGILLSNLHMLDEKSCTRELLEVYQMWLSDGGESTLSEYMQLSDEESMQVLKLISEMKTSVELYVGDKKYLLAHTVPEVDRIADYEEWTIEDFTWGEPDYEEQYFDDMFIVTGHTPTGLIERKSAGRIWKGNNHIAIDCGAVFGNPLGCICLDTMEEFYV